MPLALFVLWAALPWLAASTFSLLFPHQRSAIVFTYLGRAERVQATTSPYYQFVTDSRLLRVINQISQVFDVPRNISIPSSAFSNGNGSFSTTMPFAAGDKVVLTMSDSTGFGAGGSTEILTVGKSLGGSCNTTSPGTAFSFTLAEALQQCQPYRFSNYIETGAVTPVTIMGVIPGGDSFALNPPTGPKVFDWTANVYNGTQIIFLMVDATYRQGGSFLNTVALSGDSSCINSKSPSSTANPLGPTSTSGSTASPSASVAATPRSIIGAIAGSVLGALIFLAVLITLGLFFLRQRQEKQKLRNAGGPTFRRNSRPMDSELDLTYETEPVSNTRPYMLQPNTITPTSSMYNFHNESQYYSGHNPPPSLQASSHPPAHYQPHSPYLSSPGLPNREDPFNPPSGTDVDPFTEQTSSGVSSTRRKSGMTAYSNYTPSRYVVHTDVEDDIPPNEDGVVELPPQYSANRNPIKGLAPSNTSTSPPL